MYCVTYIPREVGLFDIRVFWNGREVVGKLRHIHIPGQSKREATNLLQKCSGSPFHPKITNPSKVRVIGGLESLMDEQNRLELTVNEERKIPLDISEAGPGVHSIFFRLSTRV